jgi:hypothetical protein
MKRTAPLEERVKEIVDEARTRDINQNFVYDELWQDPMTAHFMFAPEALFEVLRDRPLFFLRLLQINKALNKLWSQFPDIWRLMTKQLVEMELNSYMSQVYPFFVVENERFFAHTAYVLNTLDFLGRNKYAIAKFGSLVVRPELGMGLGLFVERQVLQGDKKNEYYYYVPYDDYTRHFVTLLQYLFHFSFNNVHRDMIIHTLASYLGISPFQNFLACYLDGFLITPELVKESDGTTRFISCTDMAPLLKRLEESMNKFKITATMSGEKTIIRILQGMRLTSTFESKVVPNPKEELAALKRLPIPTELTKAVRLDATTIKPFYEKLSLMYASTPQGEKTLFLRLLGSFIGAPNGLSLTGDDPSKIMKYSSGNNTLPCFTCHTQTLFVDPHLELAFCRAECRALYTK